jgi:hypothetical protein
MSSPNAAPTRSSLAAELEAQDELLVGLVARVGEYLVTRLHAAEPGERQVLERALNLLTNATEVSRERLSGQLTSSLLQLWALQVVFCTFELPGDERVKLSERLESEEPEACALLSEFAANYDGPANWLGARAARLFFANLSQAWLVARDELQAEPASDLTQAFELVAPYYERSEAELAYEEDFATAWAAPADPTIIIAAALDEDARRFARESRPQLQELRQLVEQTLGEGREIPTVMLPHQQLYALLDQSGGGSAHYLVFGFVGDLGQGFICLDGNHALPLLGENKLADAQATVVHEYIHTTQPDSGKLLDGDEALVEGVTEALTWRLLRSQAPAIDDSKPSYPGSLAFVEQLAALCHPDYDRQTEMLRRLSAASVFDYPELLAAEIGTTGFDYDHFREQLGELFVLDRSGGEYAPRLEQGRELACTIYREIEPQLTPTLSALGSHPESPSLAARLDIDLSS